MEMLKNIQIESQRIKLVPLTKKYRTEIFREFSYEITQYMFPKSPESIEETDLFISKCVKDLEKGTDLIMAIVDIQTGDYLGNVGIHKIGTSIPELGIWVKKSAHGNGYGKEAVQLIKLWADKNIKYQYITYPVDINNTPSRKIPESMDGVVVREYDKRSQSGNVLHLVEYRIPSGN
ncbi:MAG: ribosomal-protein-alanine N-acetyltransferase [Acidimicrobiales bacterium]|jgi:ribosomal-protein-alanine N-acetyltransferase